jgi:hypothetical protein
MFADKSGGGLWPQYNNKVPGGQNDERPTTVIIRCWQANNNESQLKTEDSGKDV